MSISFHLSNFPLLCQLHEDSGHLYPDVNADMDCVPTSIAAALTWFTGQQYYGDEIIDSVYGSGYTGGTAAVQYEAYCAARNAKLYPVNGTQQELVMAIHAFVHENCPVLVTVPGHWNDPATSATNPGGVTHVMVVCGDGPSSIQVMNPWTGSFEEYSDAWFLTKLCYGQVWPMEKVTMNPKSVVFFTFGQGPLAGKGLADVAADLDITVEQLKSIPQNAVFANYDNQPASVAGMQIALPGFASDTSALQAELAKAQEDLTSERQEVVNLNVTIGQLKAALAAAQTTGHAEDSAALDELAKALPMLSRALASRAPSPLPAPIGAQTKPLPAVQ